jgi:hypothetical protein
VWADKTLKISKGDFEKPSKKISIELNCPKETDEGLDEFDDSEAEKFD